MYGKMDKGWGDGGRCGEMKEIVKCVSRGLYGLRKGEKKYGEVLGWTHMVFR